MDRLDAMNVFIATVETGSFSAASRKLDVPLATVSRKVAELEEHLKVRLLVRSTRKLALTDVGQAYFNACREILERVADAESTAAGEFSAPRGHITVTAPIVFGRIHLLPLVNEFLANFPEIYVRLALSDSVLHMTDDHIDVAVRIGHLPDSTMVARQVGTVCRVVCASPRYFAGHGVPRTPEDLRDHACVSFEALHSGPQWTFNPRTGKPPSAIAIRPRLSVTTAEAAIDAAIAGVGLTYVLSYQVATAVEQLQLQLALREYEPTPIPVSVMHLDRRMVPNKIRSFVDFVVPRLQARLSGDKDRLRAGAARLREATRPDATPVPHDVTPQVR